MESHEEEMLLRRLFSGRIRVIVFILSLAGLVVVSLLILLRPSPSTVVRISHPSRHRKVSVIFCLTLTTKSEYTALSRQIGQVMARLHLEHELMVVPPTSSSSEQIISWLQGSAHHVELVPLLGSCEQTLPTVFSRAHFSVLLLLGGGLATLNSTLSQLLLPVIHDTCDLVVADLSKSSGVLQGALSFLLSPLTGAVLAPSSLVFTMSRAGWGGCEGVRGEEGSLVTELLVKCRLRHWQTVSAVPSSPASQPHPLSLTQVLSLYWSTYPVLCVLALVGVVSVCLICCRLGHHCPQGTLKANGLVRI